MVDENLLVNYNIMEELRPKHMPDEIKIWDETLRDGEQTPGVALSVDEKISIAKMMDEMGIHIIDAGFPAVAESERKVVKTLAKEGFSNSSLLASARTVHGDIDACVDCDVDEIATFIAASDLHIKYKLKMSREEVIQRAVDAIQYAKDHGVVVNFVTEDSTRSDLEYLTSLYKAAEEAGTDRIVISDTVGFARPAVMKHIISHLRERLNIPLSVHCHNDFGLATANTLAAIEEGVSVPHTCINGYGERAGNAPLEEVVMALEILYGYDTVIKTERMYELSKLTEDAFLVPLAIHKPIVGENAFSHEAGIHVHGVLAHALTYEPIPPEMVGRDRSFFLGKHTGAHIVEFKLKEKGITAPKDKLIEIVQQIKFSAETRSKEELRETIHKAQEVIRKSRGGISEEEFWEIVEKVLGVKV
jgi:2-isopropylmalate synthase